MRKVSVILPVFNAERYLRNAVESILAQTHADFEFLIHDDGSNDRSLEVLKEYAKLDTRISLTFGRNQGITATLNNLIDRAGGEYIVRMDADDISLPERIEKQIMFLETHPEYCVVGGLVRLIDPHGRQLIEFAQPTSHEEIDAAHLKGDVFICHPAATYRKDCAIRVGGYLEAYPFAEDIDLWLRMAEVGKLANIPEVVLLYRLHFSSIGYLRRPKQIDSHLRAITDAYGRRGIGSGPEFQPPPYTRISRSATYRQWGWWALSSGKTSTARIYSAKAFLREPLGKENWRLMYCALRGR